VRRGDGPAGCFDYTFASLAATAELIATQPDKVAAMVRALKRAHTLLKEDPERATTVGSKVFPPEQAALISRIIQRDLPYYDPTISPESVTGMNAFAQRLGILDCDVPYESIVATGMQSLWAA
jgi:ABC-type nitrate/sulfonate/bicarbonate transport system substrate-binding protein